MKKQKLDRRKFLRYTSLSALVATGVAARGGHPAMKKLKKEGKVRHVGVSCHGSNWEVDTEEGLDTILQEAQRDMDLSAS